MPTHKTELALILWQMGSNRHRSISAIIIPSAWKYEKANLHVCTNRGYRTLLLHSSLLTDWRPDPSSNCFFTNAWHHYWQTNDVSPYSATMGWLRCRLSFSLLRTSIMCIQAQGPQSTTLTNSWLPQWTYPSKSQNCHFLFFAVAFLTKK